MDNLTALLLVGGKGTRLRPVISSTPKPLASIGDKPFLELLVGQLREQGIRDLVMCTGYMADQIEAQFGDGAGLGVRIRYSREQEPLGTGGAVKFAAAYLDGVDEFLVMNGDSYVDMDLRRLVALHREKRGLMTLAVRLVPSTPRYGTVRVDGDSRVTAFVEKSGLDVPGLINAGVYVFRHEVLDRIPTGVSSLELDVFPHLLDEGVYALEQHGRFIDIGTPEDYARAQEML